MKSIHVSVRYLKYKLQDLDDNLEVIIGYEVDGEFKTESLRNIAIYREIDIDNTVKTDKGCLLLGNSVPMPSSLRLEKE